MPQTVLPVKPYFPSEDIEEAKATLQEILSSGMLTLGKHNAEFEKEFSRLCKVDHAVAVNSGTSALEISLRCIGLKEGDEVLLPTNTFAATAAAVIFAGGRPVLTDIDPESLCLSPEVIRDKISDKIRGIIAVHIGGLVCPDILEIKDICKNRKLFLIEDAAHAAGSMIGHAPAGSIGDTGCFSFYPTKVITTAEGGMMTTNDGRIAAKAKIMRDQGKESFSSSSHVALGNNWRLSEISAALGVLQLKRLGEIIDRRNGIARLYDKAFKSMDGTRPILVSLNSRSNYYKYTVILPDGVNRDGLKQKLRADGVICGSEVYWPPLHLQPYYQELLGTKLGDFPVAEDVCSRMICPPLNSQMTNEDASFVTDRFAANLGTV